MSSSSGLAVPSESILSARVKRAFVIWKPKSSTISPSLALACCPPAVAWCCVRPTACICVNAPRWSHDKIRPLLQVADPLGKLRDLHTQRDPLYRETAQFNIDTGRPSVASLVQIIVSQLAAAGLVSV